MKYYVKQALLPVANLIFTAMIAFGILYLGEELTWLKVILLIFNLALFTVSIGAVAYKEGQEAFHVRYTNDLERKEIIRTGEDRPLKLHEEYKWWKGFFYGFIACVPQIILLIIHVICVLAFGPSANAAGIIAGLLYMNVFAFFRVGTVIGSSNVVENFAVGDPWLCFWVLVAIPVIVLATGLPYYFGARKMERQHLKINGVQNNIYGD